MNDEFKDLADNYAIPLLRQILAEGIEGKINHATLFKAAEEAINRAYGKSTENIDVKSGGLSLLEILKKTKNDDNEGLLIDSD